MTLHLTPEHVETIMCELASGDSLQKIMQRCGIPLKVFWRLLADDESVRKQYELAQRCKAQTLIEEILDIADDRNTKGDDKRIKIETRLKIAAKYFPQMFGDVQRVEHSGAVQFTGLDRVIVDAPVAKATDDRPVKH